MKQSEIKKRLEAGESPTDLSVEKYRKLQCRVMKGEKLIPDDMQSDTCALCQSCDSRCGECALTKNGDKCTYNGDSPWKSLMNEVCGDHDKQTVLDLIDNMILALKAAKKYEEIIKKVTYHCGQKFQFRDEETYVLVNHLDKIYLFDLKDGNCWNNSGATYKDQKEITEEEMKKLTDTFGYWKCFHLVEE
jgi:hypothetical protein